MGHGTDLIILLRLLLLLVAGLLWTWSVVLMLLVWLLWLPPTHAGQNTRSQVSQQSSSWPRCR